MMGISELEVTSDEDGVCFSVVIPYLVIEGIVLNTASEMIEKYSGREDCGKNSLLIRQWEYGKKGRENPAVRMGM